MGEIINWGLRDKDKNKWEWMKIRKKIGSMNITSIAMEIVNERMNQNRIKNWEK